MSNFNVGDINLDMDSIDSLDDILQDDSSLMTAENKPIKKDLSFFHNIPVDVTLEVASTKLVIGDLMMLSSGAVIELDKLADEPLDVKVNGQLLATAEVVVVNGKYGVKLIDVVDDVVSGLKA
ncbi:flagellar motor switch protein FliN [Moritella viscosa]|uniref:Flagellar motor switch protein FliN n=1 Tax=Moritella viscosa TaxID=80854 RepID=A0ABY1HB50_9GAMM|nr:flagellar motor switch protein FliN [Moritella viscosa]CED58775.1 flagellar motor switch protein FliN [Moritella viscosa]SGY83618.1 Flagellar motor switch protein [Moritella viscosa]SGY84186.1 Flagellar motor switch protein [Moritella viscosa]SGY84308.1 Flagellar motor switch protein [Moritella viscosa]SGY85135.1 Flagellar motor switch protein [Moritella viscosa]